MKTSRRRFLQRAAASGALLPFSIRRFLPTRGIPDDVPTQAQIAADPLRPQIHLLPKRNWMNDPNGPIFWNGQYHMFYQFNPNAAVWGDMHWAHAVSPDMLHWQHLPLALAPTPGGYDSEGCFSGSAVNDNGVATFLYTGVQTVSPEQATLRDGTHNFREVQCLATSADKELRTWQKLPEPALFPPQNQKLTGFRDPCLWRDGKTWFMGIGSGVKDEGGNVLLYRSADLRNWEYLHPLAQGKRNGKGTPDPVDAGEMWECPDFFPLGNKHVLLYSTERKVYWQSGTLDPKELVFHPEKQGLLDHGAFYAPKSQLDATGRRILWGWIPETRPEAQFSAAGWAGCMSLPRVLSLRDDGELHMSVIPEIYKLRQSRLVLPPARKAPAARPAALRQLEWADGPVEITIRWNAKPLNFRVTDGARDVFALTCEASNLQIGASSRAADLAATADGMHEATIFLDASVTECFVDGHMAWTTRTYYIPRGKLRVEVAEEQLANLQALNIWLLQPVSPDRLTS